MQVLVELAKQDGEVATRQAIIETVWPKSFSGDEALTRCISQLRSFFGDNPHDPHYIKTIPKKGYKLVAPVVAIEEQSPIDLPQKHQKTRQPRVTQFLALIAFCAILIKVLVIGLDVVDQTHESPDLKVIKAPYNSVCILPFKNLSGDTFDDTVAAGIAATIISTATTFEDLLIVAGGIGTVDSQEIRQLSDQLGVATVLSGSVQRAHGRYRITAQLIDGVTGFRIWSLSWDLDNPISFNTQDKISEEIVAALRTTLHDNSSADVALVHQE